MAYRVLQVDGRVLSCQSKPNDNKRLQEKISNGLINFVCACFFSEWTYMNLPGFFTSEVTTSNILMAIARVFFCTLAFSLLVK